MNVGCSCKINMYSYDNKPSYKGDFMISMKIMIGNNVDRIDMTNSVFKKIMKVNTEEDNGNSLPWVHEYDLSLPGKNNDNIGSSCIEKVCNMIYDFFHLKRIIGNSSEEYGAYFMKFINVYVLPHITDEKLVGSQLAAFEIHIIKEPFSHALEGGEYTKHEQYIFRSPPCKGKFPFTYTPYGDLRDLDIYYQAICCNYYAELSNPKWFRSMSCILDYLNLTGYVKMFTNISTYEGSLKYKPECIELPYIEKSPPISFIFEYGSKTTDSNKAVLELIRRIIQTRNDIVFCEEIMTNENIIDIINKYK